MKKDFSQPFINNHVTFVHVLAEDVSSGQFLTIRFSDQDIENDGAYSEEFWRLPTFELNAEDNLAQHLVKTLASYGFVTNQYREISRVSRLLYSFIDDTQGEEIEYVCVHASVEHVDFFPAGLKENESVHVMSLTDLSATAGLDDSATVVRLGLASLHSERDIFSKQLKRSPSQ